MGADQARYLEWTLGWSAGPRVLVVGLAIAVLVLAWWNSRPLPLGRRAVVLCLRGLLVAALVAVLMQPTWVTETEQAGRRLVAVVIDASRSMARGAGGQSRFDRARAAAATLANQQQTRVWTLRETVGLAKDAARLAAFEANGESTDLLASIEALTDLDRPAGLAAVVLISDGIDNGRLAARNPASTDDRPAVVDDATAALIGRLGVPVHAILIVDDGPATDVAISALRASSFAFARTALPVAVDLRITGYSGRSGEATVRLTLDGREVASERVSLDGPISRTVDFEVEPRSVGRYVLGAEVVPLPDEATALNNSLHTTLQVVRDRVRILHLAGRPSWDARFLREHLHGDPGVDLMSFYVLVDPGEGLFVQGQDTTLIPFPTNELFGEALDSFDLVVLQDFPLGPFGVDEHLPRIATWLQQGGGLLVVGGPTTLAAGSYRGSGLDDLLPVAIDALTGADDGYDEGLVAPQLTPLGRGHPILRVRDDAQANVDAWAAARLPGHNTALIGRAGHTLAVTGDGSPLIAFGPRGRGRSAVVASDGLWTWAFPPDAGESARDQHRQDYHRLLDHLLGWLVGDPAWATLLVDGPERALFPGEEVSLAVRVRGPDLQPRAGAQVRWLVVPMNDPASPADATAEAEAFARAAHTWPQTTDADGTVTLRLAPQAPGRHNVIIGCTVDDVPYQTTVPLAVEAAGAEDTGVHADGRLLGLLVRASGGEMLPERPTAAVRGARNYAADWISRERSELWSRAEVWWLLVVLLGLEWWLRRRWGLA